MHEKTASATKPNVATRTTHRRTRSDTASASNTSGTAAAMKNTRYESGAIHTTSRDVKTSRENPIASMATVATCTSAASRALHAAASNMSVTARARVGPGRVGTA